MNEPRPDTDRNQPNSVALVLRELVPKVLDVAIPEAASSRVIERNGKIVIDYARGVQNPEDVFTPTTNRGQFFTRDFRGKPDNVSVRIQDEAGLEVTDKVGSINLTVSRVRYDLERDGTITEVVKDEYGNDSTKRRLSPDEVYEVVDLVTSLEPGQMWWVHGVPEFPEDRTD